MTARPDIEVQRALNAVRDANFGGLSRTDQDALTQLVVDFFVDNDDDHDDSNTETSDGEHGESHDSRTTSLEPKVSLTLEEESDEFFAGNRSGEDDDGPPDMPEDDDGPPVEVDAGLRRVEHLLGDAVSDDVERELQRARDFNCGCRTFNGGACIRQFAVEDVVNLRLDMHALTEGEKDLILLGIFHTSMDTSETVFLKGPGRKESRERRRTRCTYTIKAKRVCAATFRYLHVVSKNKVSAVQQWYREHGLMPRKKKSGGRVSCASNMTYEDTVRVYHFIHNLAEDHALVLPGRVPGYKRGDLRLLPSTYTKSGIWRDFYKPAMETEGHRVAALSTFTALWRQLSPEIVCCKPMTDLCWECQKNNNLILRTVNCDEDTKTETLRKQESHLVHVREERALYKKQVSEAKEVVAAGTLKLGQNLPCSRDIRMHYSFDFAQQVHFPSNPLQPGPMYFLTPRKCGIFGVCCEGIPTQVNYLIDEGMASTKGSNAVISYLHHFFSTYGLGETAVSLHCDNCSGQNKNRFMLFYLLWRTIHGLHQEITLNFMVAGHTKFSPDWCFGLLKQKYRRTTVSSLNDIARLTNSSTVTGVNQAQLVGSENQDIFVPSYNWQAFLGNFFKPLNGIKSLQHFRFSSTEPGAVYASKHPNETQQRFVLLRRQGAHPPAELPQQTPPPGLDAKRQWYLYNKIREFCSQEGADLACPRPTIPCPNSNDDEDEPHEKIKRKDP